MRAVASGVVATGLVAGFLLLFGLVNAGNVYRVECPRAGGPTEAEWTWDPISIPYVGDGRSGCETHTSTRLALDAVGLWSIGDAPTNNPDVGFELNQPYDSSFIDLWVRGCVSSGDSVAFCRCAINEYTTRLRPDEFETAAAVAHSGGQLSELSENLRDDIKAVERNCR
jgi:hypothetical protein